MARIKKTVKKAKIVHLDDDLDVDLDDDLDDDDFVSLATILSQGIKQGTINKPIKSKPNLATTKSIDSLQGRLDKEISKIEEKLEKLKRDRGLYDDGRIFVYRKSYSLDEIRDWCFEQNIVFKMENATILSNQVRLLIFRTREDAMAFKLTFL